MITFDKAVEKIGIDHSDFGLKTNEEDVEYVDHIVKSTGEIQRLALISSFRTGFHWKDMLHLAVEIVRIPWKNSLEKLPIQQYILG